MNGSWSDQDLSRESDLTEPDSQSGTSEGEFESFEAAGHRTEENNMNYEDQTENGNAVDSGGLLANHDQSTEGEEDDISYNSSEHHHPDVVGEDEAEGPPEGRLEDSGETMEGGEPVVNEKRQTVINMHHVDLILDNIDAELNDIINRSLNSEHSEHSYHGNSSSSGTSRHSQKASTLTRQEPESSDNATADETLEDDSASDTGLGTGSHRGDSSPIPNGDHVRHRSAVGKVDINGEGKGTKLKNGSNRSFKKKVSKRQALVEFSDGDSICSDDVRMRMEETLNLQDSDTDALPSQHSHNPSHTHDALQKHNRSLPSSATASNSTKSWNRRRGVPDEADNNRTEDSSQSDDNHETQDISSRIQEMVSLVLSDSTTDPLFDEASSPNLSNNHQSRNLPRTNHNTQRTTGAIHSSENGRTHQSLPPDSKSFLPDSKSFLEHRRAGRGIDADSIATEDFEHVFQTSIVTHDPPSTTSRSPLKTTRNNPSNRNEAKRIPSASPKKTDHLTVPGMGKRGKSRSKKKRTNTLPTSKPSGLPEYMYLRKGVTESDVGSDSIRTEDYEGHFEVARVTDQHNSPKYANLSNITRSRHAQNVQSDPESIQTEEYEQRFRSLMVKQVAGVPVKSFDQVTIASNLESVETGMVHEKFQEALRKGPEVRVFNEFGDQSDLDPLQMEEVERKFQKILRKKKIEKMRRSKKDGDTEDDVTSDMDSVRAIPSKSETGSPPNRQSKNGRSRGHRHHNGVQVKHSGRSRDASPRTNTYNTTRSSPRGAPSSPWSTPRDVSPSPPQKSPTAVATAVNFPFNYHPPVVARSCGNHHDKNPARDHQANSYSRVNGHRHPEDAPRMKQENKKKKKRPLRDNGIKTSTPKANPNNRHQGDGGRDIEGDTEEGTSNDHQATIRELLETETKMRRKLDELESSFEEVSSRKQDALDDLKTLREAVHRNKRDIQKAEEIARENMERADGLRSELMVLEYQRDQARRDLEDLTQSLGSFKQSHRHGVSEDENDGTGNNLLGLSPKEVIAVIKERDELKTRLRNGEGDLSPIERSELERQLNYTKQELFNGQKSSREKLESLEEELDESRHRMDELLVEKTNLAEKVQELQALVGSEQSNEMHSHLEERNQLLEQLSSKLQKELDPLRHQAHERDQRLQSLTATASEKDALNSALRDKMVEMQREAEEDRREAERRVKEAEGKVRNADVAKELALVELRETLLREKEEEMAQLKLSFEKEKKEALTALDEKTSEMMMITQRSLTEKEEDLKAVKLQLVQHTEEANKMEQQLREQAEEQIKAAVDKERQDREEEYSRRRREENVEKELEVAKETSRLQGELLVTRQRLEHQQTTVGVLKEELDKLREENLAAGREKVEAVSEAREKAREDIQRELDQLREQLAKENLLEVDRLRMKQRQQEEELTKLRSEVKVHQDQEARSAGVTGSKSILAEINEECKRTAAVIGSTPMKMNISSIRGSKSLNGTLSPKSPLHSTPDSAHGPGRTQVMAALTNLRISNEELRNFVQTLKTDLERQKRALSKVQKEKDEEVKKVANTIEKKSGDMDTMRDRLIQDHLSQVEELQQQISRQRTTDSALQQRLLDKDSELREIQQSMTQWKEETALKMAKKFEEELGKELEIRLQETGKRDGSSYRGSQSDRGSRNSSGNGSPSIVSSASDASTIRLLRHLQERVKQLRTENMTLRRSSSRGPFESSGEERASPHSSKNSESEDKDHLLYQMQQRVKLLERQLQVAEERCRENAASVSEKVSENSRLQGALTQQTKELMKMERAYSKLASPGRTPVRM